MPPQRIIHRGWLCIMYYTYYLFNTYNTVLRIHIPWYFCGFEPFGDCDWPFPSDSKIRYRGWEKFQRSQIWTLDRWFPWLDHPPSPTWQVVSGTWPPTKYHFAFDTVLWYALIFYKYTYENYSNIIIALMEIGAYQNTVSKRIKPRAEISFPPIQPRDLISESLIRTDFAALLAVG